MARQRSLGLHTGVRARTAAARAGGCGGGTGVFFVRKAAQSAANAPWARVLTRAHPWHAAVHRVHASLPRQPVVLEIGVR